MEQTFDEYIRMRNDPVDRTPVLEAWVEWQATKNTPSLRGKRFTSGTSSRSGESESGNEDEDSDTQRWGDIHKSRCDVQDAIYSQGEREMKTGCSESFTFNSSVNTKKNIDPRWRPYHGDPITCDLTVPREEFDRYRVLAEKQMKRLRQEKDQLLKMYSGKCDDLHKEIEKRETQETPKEPEHESTSAREIEEKVQLPGNFSDRKDTTIATLSTGEGLEEIDVFADSPFESVQKATNVIREARELRVRVLLQRAATLSTVKRWNTVEKRALEALELVERLGKPSVEAKCWFWYGLALYNQGQIVEAAASFTESKVCRSKKDPEWANSSEQVDGNGMDPDKWVKHCEELIAEADIEDSPVSDGNGGHDDGSIDPRIQTNAHPDPDTPWYSVPRCSVGIGNWVMGVVNTDPNTLVDESRDEEEESGKWEDARDEWGQLKDSIETTRSLTLEDELAECAIGEGSCGPKDMENQENMPGKRREPKSTQGEDKELPERRGCDKNESEAEDESLKPARQGELEKEDKST